MTVNANTPCHFTRGLDHGCKTFEFMNIAQEYATRPLVNMKGKTPAQYYGLRNMRLQEYAMNTMFNNHGCGYDQLPVWVRSVTHTPTEIVYYSYIFK